MPQRIRRFIRPGATETTVFDGANDRNGGFGVCQRRAGPGALKCQLIPLGVQGLGLRIGKAQLTVFFRGKVLTIPLEFSSVYQTYAFYVMFGLVQPMRGTPPIDICRSIAKRRGWSSAT
jgi:hypothetical protein